uniref:Uncharacterized protein n=1 Tax=Arundo donax TaxID=35708 RepID=A0A0A9I2T0_ARUDO
MWVRVSEHSEIMILVMVLKKQLNLRNRDMSLKVII